jgi:hypothetical protein
VSWEYPSEADRQKENELGAAMRRNKQRALEALAKEREASAQEQSEAFRLDASLNQKLKAWHAGKSIVDVLNSLGDIVPKCAPSFSVPAR